MAAFLSREWWREFIHGKEEADLLNLTASAAAMEKGMVARKDATTTQMAISSQKRDELKGALGEYERWRAYAARLDRDGRAADAEKAALQAAAFKQKVDELGTQYEAARAAADRAIQTYQVAEKRVQERVLLLPGLEAQQRLNRLMAESNRVMASYGGASAAFDKIARQIRLSAEKMDAALLLENVGADVAQLEIGRVIQQQDAQAILAEVRAQAALPQGAVPAALPSPVDRARALLEAPRFATLDVPAFGARGSGREDAIDADYVPVPAMRDAEPKKE